MSGYKDIIKIYPNINDIDFDMLKEQYSELMNSPAYNDNEIEKYKYKQIQQRRIMII